MVLRILTNTPVWVWGLLLVLLWLGFSQTRARSIGLRRILILPLVMTGLSLSGTISSFGVAPLVLLAWAITTGIGTWLVIRRPVPQSTRYDSTMKVFFLPGSWLPLGLILGIFAIKYATGATLVMHPALANSTGFSTAVGALYGAFTGVFIGRAGRLWRLGC